MTQKRHAEGEERQSIRTQALRPSVISIAFSSTLKQMTEQVEAQFRKTMHYVFIERFVEKSERAIRHRKFADGVRSWFLLLSAV